jgi:hypothetical protein
VTSLAGKKKEIQTVSPTWGVPSEAYAARGCPEEDPRNVDNVKKEKKK